MKKIVILLKRFIMSFFVLYGYNLIAVNFNMIIPINIITISLLTIFGVPSLLSLLLLKIIAL